jgi:hypothetical protein
MKLICFLVYSFCLLYSCEKKNKYSKHEWHHKKIVLNLNQSDQKDEINTKDLDACLNFSGYQIYFSNFLIDSRNTPMNYNEWKKIALKVPSSELETAEKIAYFGENAHIFNFCGDHTNKGFLVFSRGEYEDVWAELWDADGVRRIRVNFNGKKPDLSEVDCMSKWLSNLRWDL